VQQNYGRAVPGCEVVKLYSCDLCEARFNGIGSRFRLRYRWEKPSDKNRREKREEYSRYFELESRLHFIASTNMVRGFSAFDF
jgi:hypothetical protein